MGIISWARDGVHLDQEMILVGAFRPEGYQEISTTSAQARNGRIPHLEEFFHFNIQPSLLDRCTIEHG